MSDPVWIEGWGPRPAEPTGRNLRLGSIFIENIAPSIDGGRFPVKRVVGEPCVVEADIFRDGHQIIRAAVKYRREIDESFHEAAMELIEDDRWRAEFVPNENCRYLYGIEAWTDPFASWLSDFSKKVIAGREVRSDLLEGMTLIERMIARAQPFDRSVLVDCIARLRSLARGSADRLGAALEAVSRPEVNAAALSAGER